MASLCAPAGVQVQLPLDTVAVQTVLPFSSLTVTTAPFSPVPVNVGVLSLVEALLLGDVITGAAGAVVSMVIGKALLAADVLPAVSVWVAVML